METSPAPLDHKRGLGMAVFLLFPLCAFLLLWETLVGGRVLLPAEYLQGFLPWSQSVSDTARQQMPQWNVLQWDGMAEFYPWRLHAARSISEGLIPLWNPFILAGTPFLANSQSAPLYPLHALLYLPWGPDLAVRMGWLAFLHLSLAGCFAYLLARDFGLRREAAVVGGIAYELSGFLVAWLELPSVVAVSCWIPLAVLCVLRAIRRQSPAWAAGGAACVGLMLLAGHLQIAFYGLLAVGLAALWELGSQLKSRTPSRLPVAIGLATGIAVLGLGLAAAQVLPALELSRMSHRVGNPTPEGYAGYVALALPLQQWITLLAPDYFGLPARGNFWGFWNYGPPNVMEYAGHLGTVGVLLVLVGLIWGWRLTRSAGLPVLFGVVALLLAAGSPLCRLFYFYVPGFAQSGSPARALVLFCLAQSLLAALGAEWLMRRASEHWKSALSPLFAGLGLTTALLGGLHLIAQGTIPQQVAALGVAGQVAIPALTTAFAFVALFAVLAVLVLWLLRESPAPQRVTALSGVCVIILAGGLVYVGQDYNLTAPRDLAYPPTPLTEALRTTDARVATVNRQWGLVQQPPALLPPNASIAYGWRDAQGYDSLLLGHYRPLYDALARPVDTGSSPPENGNILFVKDVSSPLFDLLGARYVVSQTTLDDPDLRLQSTSGGAPFLYENTSALPEAYLATRWFAADPQEGLRRLESATPVERRTSVFLSPGTSLPEPTPGPDTAGTVVLKRETPQSLTARVETGLPAMLVLLEGYAPGWKATVTENGQEARPVEIHRVNGSFQGVYVERTPATVTFRYQPDSFRVGLFFTLLALATILGLSLTGRQTRPADGTVRN